MPPHQKVATLRREQIHSKAIQSNLFSEQERLETFRDWPNPAITPEELAVNGFYFTGRRDVVRCAFCGIEAYVTGAISKVASLYEDVQIAPVGKSISMNKTDTAMVIEKNGTDNDKVGVFEEGDSASVDHQRYSPNCDLVCGRPCGNIPRGSPSIPSYDTCGPFGHLIRPFSGPEKCYNGIPTSTMLQDLEHLGVSKTSGPVNPDYGTEQSRLRSFVNWPADCPVKPDTLAAAGFYSTANSDHALCFYCGGGLRDWEEGDDPWEEHARWFSRCGFILMNKGREYVQNILQKKPAVIPAETLNELLEKAQEDLEKLKTSRNSAQKKESEEATETSKQEVKKEKAEDVEVANPEKMQNVELCTICYARARVIVFLPCGHFASCAMCAAALSKCPVCRKPYEGTVRAFLS